MNILNDTTPELSGITFAYLICNLLAIGELFACRGSKNGNSAYFESIVRVRSLVDRQLGLLNGDLKPEVGNSSVADSLSKSNHQNI